MPTSQFGLIGLAVMGQNLARNIASRSYVVSVFNRTYEKTETFIEEYGSEGLFGFKNLKDFVSSLEKPRKIILMVKAGKAVDEIIELLLPFLEGGDIVIDGGNSLFKDTVRREKDLSEKGIHFVGSGVSGGEEGALRGPSLMPGGSEKGWKEIQPIFEKIAAKDFSGGPCVTHVGENGAGHFVKMVHNGIEYGVMQLIAEVYDVYRKIYNLPPTEIADIFEEYNNGKLESFLTEITILVLRKVDEGTDAPLVDLILDSAGQKGTGRWTVTEALELGVAVPTITAATLARIVSSYKDTRVGLAKKYTPIGNRHACSLQSIDDAKQVLENALYAATLTSYAEGFELIKAGAEEYGWNIDYKEVSRIWEGGCIIRSRALNLLREAFNAHKGTPPHLFAIQMFQDIFKESLPDWQSASRLALDSGISTPALHASLSYFQGMADEKSSANMIQGLRDLFGAHTYERTDKEGVFHTEDWT